MKIFIDTRSGVPIYKQIIRQIERGIVGGLLNPGDRLPTVREVALDLTVNPNTVARAYRELEQMGIIESVQGRGTFISETLPRPSGSDKEELIAAQLAEAIREARHLNISPSRLKEMFKYLLNSKDE